MRALRHRDLSAAGVEARLERAGVDSAGRRNTLETLERVGYVDDARFAARRAGTLAERGWGDTGIAADLEAQGLPSDAASVAVAGLEPERVRAARIVAARGGGQKTAAYLSRRGFGEEAVEQALVAEEA